MSTQKCAKCLCSMDSRYLVQRKYVHVEDGPDGPVKSFLVCESGDCSGEWLEDYRGYIPPCTSIGEPEFVEELTNKIPADGTAHTWWKSSGTTVTCEICGIVRYSLDIDGQWCSVRRALSFEYGKDPCSAVKTAPACVAVDGLEWSHGMGAAQQRSAVPPLTQAFGPGFIARLKASAAARKGEA